MASVKVNITLNVINTVLGLLFPLITFPYVSRILMPSGIGQIQFYQSIINYIVLLSSLGIPLYSVREIAKVRDDEVVRNRTTAEILTLHGLLSIIGYLIVFVLICTVTKIYSDWPLFLLLSSSIFFNVIGVSWFYQAVEDFKYITIRSLIVRVVAMIALFVFVRTKDDIYTYAIILVGAEVGNYVFNFYRLRHYMSFSEVSYSALKIKRHLKPIIKIFLLNFAISIYVNLNPIMLGFMTDTTIVGYYTSVTKIIRASNGLTLALGSALLPRLSNYFGSGRFEEFNILKRKALDVIMLLCVPLSMGIFIVAPYLIPVFSGKEYMPAILTLQISAPAILFSALNYIISIQILYSQNKENLVIMSTAGGAVVNVIINLLLIPHFQQNGAAAAGCLAELAVLICCFLFGHKYIRYNFINRNNLEVIVMAVLSCLAAWGIGRMTLTSDIYILGLQIVVSVIIYCAGLYLLRNKLFMEYSGMILNKLRRNRF
ncbi:MAG: flippase [Muribaculaceae bacterium]|nr:flippase [Muribaculaceae bacterium]MDE6753223.1 flippase [Muribaculaceae bacterium]